MCLAPPILRDGTKVRCRKCWQCIEARVDGWVGRCIAESRTSVVSASVTLTYGRDELGNESHLRAAVLTYSDVQKYIKQLRYRGLKFTFLVAGEIGSAKGRTHWHILLFFKKKLPDGFWDFGQNSWHRAKRKKREAVWVPLVWNKRFNEPCWAHGFSHWQTMHFGHEKGGVRYACKYITKDVDDPEAQTKLCMSKRPPIGALYFDQLSMKLVEEGVAPQDPYYSFPNQARRKNGNVIRFQLANKSSDLYCEAFIRNWRGLPKPWDGDGPRFKKVDKPSRWDRARERQGPPVYTGRPWHYPASEYVEEFADRMALLDMEARGETPEMRELEGKYKTWRENETETVPEQPVYLTQTEWLQARSKNVRLFGHKVEPLFVLWLHKSPSLGRYKKAKLQKTSGPARWLQSQAS